MAKFSRRWARRDRGHGAQSPDDRRKAAIFRRVDKGLDELEQMGIVEHDPATDSYRLTPLG